MLYIYIYIYILLTKTTAVQNEFALRYYRVRGLYFLAVVFCGDYIYNYLITNCTLEWKTVTAISNECNNMLSIIIKSTVIMVFGNPLFIAVTAISK